MTVYRKTKGLKNSEIYWRGTGVVNGKFLGGHAMKFADVPANVVDLLKSQQYVDDTRLPSVEKPYKRCVFCNVETKFYRVINSQTVDLCDEHYHNKSLGEVAARVREVTKPDYDAIDILLNGPKGETDESQEKGDTEIAP